MRILFATDAFPPVSGGSGWSTYELARGLRARGHHLVIVQTHSGEPPVSYDGFEVIGFPVHAPAIPFVRNYVRNERLYPRLAAFLATLIRDEHIDLIHGQHELTGPAAITAARRQRIPSVCTVRDYWPLCYWSDLMRGPATGDVCPGCSAVAMTRCLPPRTGAMAPLSSVAIPYMRSNLSLKQRTLAHANAIVAVSARVQSYLRERSALLAGARIEVIPNGVDIQRIRDLVRASAPPSAKPYAVFVGKLATNKGASMLGDVMARSGIDMPLVIVGAGPERSKMVEAAAGAAGRITVLDWLPRDEVFRWLGHASMLIFPSNWPEPLSRVLLEASALGVPIAAMNTGGTAEVIVDEETGLLSDSVEELASDVARLAGQPELRSRLGAGAARLAAQRFEISAVAARIEHLYGDLTGSY